MRASFSQQLGKAKSATGAVSQIVWLRAGSWDAQWDTLNSRHDMTPYSQLSGQQKRCVTSGFDQLTVGPKAPSNSFPLGQDSQLRSIRWYLLPQ